MNNIYNCKDFECFDGCITSPYYCPHSENYKKSPCFLKKITCFHCNNKDNCKEYDQNKVIWETK